MQSDFDYSKVTPMQQQIADAIVEYTNVFFVDVHNEYALICDVERALPEGEEAVAVAFFQNGDLLHARDNAKAVYTALMGRGHD